jgi:anti-anti-sigma factor
MEPKDIEIIEEEHGLFYLLKIKGGFTAKNVLHLRSRIEYAINLGHTKLCMDLSGVGFMDSTGIGLIVNVFKNITKLKGQLIIVNPGETVQKLFAVSSMAKCLEIRYNVDNLDSLFD